jgi:hypothetical protein
MIEQAAVVTSSQVHVRFALVGHLRVAVLVAGLSGVSKRD